MRRLSELSEAELLVHCQGRIDGRMPDGVLDDVLDDVARIGAARDAQHCPDCGGPANQTTAATVCAPCRQARQLLAYHRARALTAEGAPAGG